MMKYGIYFAYWEQEWGVDQKQYIEKVKKLGFDVLEISCAMLKNISTEELHEIRKRAEDAGVTLTAGYGPAASENLASSDPEVVKNAIALWEAEFIPTGRWITQSPLTRRETGQEAWKTCAG